MNWNCFLDLLKVFPERLKRHIDMEIKNSVIYYKANETKKEFKLVDFEQRINNQLIFDNKENILYSDFYYECIVEEKGSNFSRRRLEELKIEDTENKINYSFQKPSFQIMIESINNVENKSRFATRPWVMRRYDEDKEPSFEDIIRTTLRFPLTLCITSEEKMTIKEYKEYANAFLFNIAYNMSLVFQPQTNLEDIYPLFIRRRTKRINSQHYIEPPKRKYIIDLTNQYHMGLSSNDPFIEFICYYHIIEHFYESVYKEDMINKVQAEISSPRFSVRRTKDIAKVIEIVQKKLKNNNAEYEVNEQEALALTLKKFVPIEELRDDLMDYDDTLVAYYRENQVCFSKGDEIIFNNLADEKIYSKIAARIYKTRNSLVHSKSNDWRTKEKTAYRPFKDEKALSKEIPLMRIIAETIIVASSELL